MPAGSAARQKAAEAALSARRGDTPKAAFKEASRQMAESMTEAELRDFAHTPRDDKPEHAKSWSLAAARPDCRLVTGVHSQSRLDRTLSSGRRRCPTTTIRATPGLSRR